MEFNVKGITFENEDGKDIQTIIKREIKVLREAGLLDEKYEGYTNTEIKEMDLNVQEYSYNFFVKVKEDIFEGKKCVKVYIELNNGEYIHVGYIPKKMLKEYEKLKEGSIKISGDAELTGGKYKHCVFDEEDEDEKVEIVELNYGLSVNLHFKYKNEEQSTVAINENNENEVDSKPTSRENKKDEQIWHINPGTMALIIAGIIIFWLFTKTWSFINALFE